MFLTSEVPLLLRLMVPVAPHVTYTLHSAPYTLHPTPYTPHPTPYTLHPTPCTAHGLYPTPYTLHPTPYTQHPARLMVPVAFNVATHRGGNLGANLESISRECYPKEVAFEWELTKENVHLPLGCLQGGCGEAKGTRELLS